MTQSSPDTVSIMNSSFIQPEKSNRGKFRCACCGSTELRWNLVGEQLILSCETCGNFARTKFLIGNEVQDAMTEIK